MRWLVATGALAIGIAAIAMRSPSVPDSRSTAKSAFPMLPGWTGSLEAPVPSTDRRSSVPTRAASLVPDGTTDETVVDESKDANEERERTLQGLTRDLGLDPEQCREVERALRDRDADIESYHREIRASKVFWVRDHDRRARQILAAAHAKIVATLSRDQEVVYERLIEEGKVVVGVSFEVTPDITVVR